MNFVTKIVAVIAIISAVASAIATDTIPLKKYEKVGVTDEKQALTLTLLTDNTIVRNVARGNTRMTASSVVAQTARSIKTVRAFAQYKDVGKVLNRKFALVFKRNIDADIKYARYQGIDWCKNASRVIFTKLATGDITEF